MTRRLNVWDFDDTLAWSSRVVERMKNENPNISYFKWWHDDEWSTKAAMDTEPILEMWHVLDRTPGVHWVLTGRNLKAVEEWMKVYRDHPEIGRMVAKVERVLSTSAMGAKHMDVAMKKQQEIQRALAVYDEIHVYDDRRMNLDAVTAVSSQVVPHFVENGRVVNASGNESLYKDLHLINNALTAIQGMETLSDTKTFREVFRSTTGIIKQLQNKLVKGLETLEVLEYVTENLERNRIHLEGDLRQMALDLDAGHQLRVEFKYPKKLRDFYGQDRQAILRAVHTLSINIETAFDRLQTPLVCNVQSTVFNEDRFPVGFNALLWRMT